MCFSVACLMALVEWTDRRRFSFFDFLIRLTTVKNYNVLYDVLFTTAWPLLRVFQRVELAGPDITFLSDHSLNEHHMKRNKLANTNNICLSRRVLFLPIIPFLRCYLCSIVLNINNYILLNKYLKNISHHDHDERNFCFLVYLYW